MGIPEPCVKSIQSKQQRYQNEVNYVVLVSLLWTLNKFHILFCVSIIDFEQVNDCGELESLIYQLLPWRNFYVLLDLMLLIFL